MANTDAINQSTWQQFSNIIFLSQLFFYNFEGRSVTNLSIMYEIITGLGMSVISGLQQTIWPEFSSNHPYAYWCPTGYMWSWQTLITAIYSLFHPFGILLMYQACLFGSKRYYISLGCTFSLFKPIFCNTPLV